MAVNAQKKKEIRRAGKQLKINGKSNHPRQLVDHSQKKVSLSQQTTKGKELLKCGD